MGGEEECPCSDSSELSNLTSLGSENANSDFKVESAGRKYDDCNCFPAKRFTSVSCQAEPANFLKNEPTCFCQTDSLAGCNIPVNCKPGHPQETPPVWNRVNWKWPRSGYLKKKDKTYEVKLKKKRCQHYPKPYMFCELSEGIPRKKEESANQNQEDSQEPLKEEPAERIDIYYFDHGNSAYYRTTDSPPIVKAEKYADKTEDAATRFWAEIFGTAHIFFAFVTAFILQLLRFLLYSVVRPLTVGILQLIADYFIKPLLSIFFNGVIQPFLILLYNVATSFRDLCEPIAEAIGFFLKEAANVLRAFRIVEVNQNAGEREKNIITACT